MTVAAADLAGLTAAKSVANTALRWVPFFLPVLAVAFGARLTTMTLVLGVAELAGLATVLLGRRLDRGGERAAAVASLVVVAAATAIALVGSLPAFALSSFLLVLGVAGLTVSGHTYLSARARYERRGRVIGTFETSWAMALLVGAPIAGVLVSRFGWRGPYVALTVATLVVAGVIAAAPDRSSLESSAPPDEADGRRHDRLDSQAVAAIAASAAIGMAGLTTIVITGTWLEDRLGVPVEGLGLVAMAFGATELAASSGSAVASDRVGKLRSTRAALVLVVTGLGVMALAGSSLAVGIGGLIVFFLGFEYAIVTSFSVVSETVPGARGRVLTINAAANTAARGAGTIATGVLYEAQGIAGPAALSATAAIAAFWLLSVVGEPS